MCVEQKLDVLKRIGQTLNRQGICWAVGGSLLLYLNGIVEGFHDIDLMVAEEDIDRAKAALDRIGRLHPQNPNAQYETRHFLEYTIDGVGIDVMAGFVIVCDGVSYECPLEPEDVQEQLLLGDETIPLHSLEKWEKYYGLMKRPQKAEMIRVYLQKEKE